jgi:diamine N-acetyltransferase
MIEIKPAGIPDASLLAELGRKTFVDTFAKDNRPEDMALYIEQTFGVERQLEEIQDPRRRIAIAWIGTTAVGFYHLLLGPPDPAVKGAKPIEILRLYVDSKWHGKGVAAALMERCIEVGRREGFATIWLGVWERNFRAQAFYRKFSFEVVGAHGFTLGTDKQTDLVMARAI